MQGSQPVLEPREKALLSAKAAQEKQGEDIVILNVGGLTTLADFFVLCSAGSPRQALAIMGAIEKSLSGNRQLPLSVEGRESALWILMDYNEVIVHIFRREAREFYNLERLWGDAEQFSLPRLKALALSKG